MYAGGESQWWIGWRGKGRRGRSCCRGRQPAAQPSTSSSAASSSNPSTSASAASSSSGRRVEEEGGGGGSKKQGRRKNQRPRDGVARAIGERLPAAASCWGNGAVVVEGIGGRRGRSRRERPGDDRGGAGDEDGPDTAAAARAPAAAWCCVCPDEECRLEANPSANGKEDPGLRTLLEHNDFFSDDCNPHSAAAAAFFTEPGDSSD